MRETFNFAQRRRMAGLVRRPRSPADLPGTETHATQSLTFPCVAPIACAARIHAGQLAFVHGTWSAACANASSSDNTRTADSPQPTVRYPIRAQRSEAE